MNALAKHTLGPWRIGDAGKTVFGPFTASPCPVMVAKMPEASPRCGAGEREANVRLIAAAPEMAEALAKIAAGVTTDCGPNQLGAVNLDAQAMQAIARAALRKAGLLS